MASSPSPSRPGAPDPSALPVSALVDYLRERRLKVRAIGGRLAVESRRRNLPLRTRSYRAALLAREPAALACLAAEAEAKRIEDSLSDLARYTLDFPDVRLPEVENARFPSLVGIYWSLAASGEPPTPTLFADEVARALARESGKSLDPAGVRARAARAYPSLVRQQHFEALLRRRYSATHHSESLDHLGIDIAVVDEGLVVGLRLAYDSAAARLWRERKERRHPLPSGLPCLDLFARAGELGVGEFWLHHRTQVGEVERFFESTRARLAADPVAASRAEAASRLVLARVSEPDGRDDPRAGIK